MDSPVALLNTIWFNNSRHFDTRGCKEHHDLRWGDVKPFQTSDGKEYFEFNERQTKTLYGDESKNVRQLAPKMWGSMGNDSEPHEPVSV